MRRNLLICLLLAAVTLAVYWPVGHLGFINNDDKGPQGYIVENTNIQAGITWESICWAFTTSYACNWHPITWLSHMLDYRLFGLNAGGHHWMNLGFHIANTLLLFVVLRKMTGAVWRSALAAALFALHPLHVESVAWVSERKDVLSALFFLLTLWAYTHYARSVTSGGCQVTGTEKVIPASVLSRVTCHRSLFYWLALLFFALGLMSKPMLVTLPLILLLLDFWPLGRLGRMAEGGLRIADLKNATRLPVFKQLLWEKAPFLALSLASGWVTVCAQQAVIASYRMPWILRLENALVTYAAYLDKFFWPANLSIFYPYYPYRPMPTWQIIGSGLLLIGIFFLCNRRMRRQPCLLVGWCWFFVMLLPVIGIIQVGPQSMADRYMYLPSIGLFIMVTWGMSEIASSSKLWRTGLAAGAAVSVLACFLDTRCQLRYWRDSVTLFSHAIEVTGESPTGNYYLANAFWETGNLNESVKHYECAIRALPDLRLARYGLGHVLLLQKKYKEAQAQFSEILQSDPFNPFALKFLGDTLSAQEEFDEADAEYSLASQYKPGDPVIEGAREKNLFLKTLQLKPDSPEVLNNLAWLLAAYPDANVRDGMQAVKYAERACELTNYKQTICVGTLAAAYAEAGRFDDAMAMAQKACTLAAAADEQDLLKKNQELLERYRAHQPYHETTQKIVPVAP